MAASGQLNVRTKGVKTSTKIIHFKMNHYDQETRQWDTLEVNGNRMTKEMKLSFKENPDGRTIRFYDIQGLNSRGDTIQFAPARFYLLESDESRGIGL